MAEAIAGQGHGELFETASAGLFPLGYVPAMTQETLRANGYSAEGLDSKPITQAALDWAERIINLSGQSRHFAFEDPSKVEDWEVADPYSGDAATYQKILEEIEERIRKLAERVKAEREASAAN